MVFRASTIGTPLVLGSVIGSHGVKGWLKIYSYTRPRERIFSYNPLFIKSSDSWQVLDIQSYRKTPKRLLIKINGIDTVECAQRLYNLELGIDRLQLETLEDGNYYWCDLLGATVINSNNGQILGEVIRMEETGANDVLVFQNREMPDKSEHRIPFLQDIYIDKVDLSSHKIWLKWFE